VTRAPGGPPTLIVGLGNPGPDYQRTRHNQGFRVVDSVAAALEAPWRSGNGPWLEASAHCRGERLLLQKPLTFMNLSGAAVAPLVAARGHELERILIVCDDIDLPLGTLRIRKRGGAGGQKGLLSVLNALGSAAVPRLRLGIGPKTGDAAEFVLSPFEENERTAADEMLSRATNLILELPGSTLDRVMNSYNG